MTTNWTEDSIDRDTNAHDRDKDQPHLEILEYSRTEWSLSLPQQTIDHVCILLNPILSEDEKSCPYYFPIKTA